MLEKIGLPPKPSLRGSNWVIDASHCQGCSSQFTFINRKHHCRRCGGLFCNGCTQQRMVLRGQGDSPVRICEPCKKLEEAARFEMRYGHKNRGGKGSSRLTTKSEDEVLNQILGNEGVESSSLGQQSKSSMVSGIRSASIGSSSSTAQETASLGGTSTRRSGSVDESLHVNSEVGSSSPEELRQRALDEKKKYKVLKGEGKSDEALKAFKRGKELERQADALELSIRKSRKKPLSSGNRAEIQIKDGPKESGRKSKLLDQVGKEKIDFVAELRDLGLSDMDLQDEGKKTVNTSLEGELFSLLGDISQRANKDAETGGIDKTQVFAHKRKALTLKREGKLAEAKEELKKAKVLEKQLEEQELLGGAEDSDDEISALIRSMDSDKQDELLVGYDAEQEHDLDYNHLMGTPDDLGVDGDFEVTDEDMMDPELAVTLKSLGWNDDSENHENIMTVSAPIDREALLSEIHSLKREALNQKQAGNVAEALAQLKKAKLLERDVENLDSEGDNVLAHNPHIAQKGSTPQRKLVKTEVDAKVAPKSRLVIQKELLLLKKKALALRREGRVDEAEEELEKGRVLEQQLEDMNNISKVKSARVNVSGSSPDLEYQHGDISGDPPMEEAGEEDVTDQDMHDPTYLSVLRNLGWNEDDNGLANSTVKPSNKNDNCSLPVDERLVTQDSAIVTTRSSRTSKAEIQRELLGLKRKALTLRREGKTSEAEEVLRSAKMLESQMAELETHKKETPVESDQNVNIMEFLTGDGRSSGIAAKVPADNINSEPHVQVASVKKSSEILERQEDKVTSSTGDVSGSYSGLSCISEPCVHVGSSTSPPLSYARKDIKTEISKGTTDMERKQHVDETKSAPGFASQNNQSSLRQEVLARKRKAVALKKDGKLAEALEELRQAKLLEKGLEDEARETETIAHDLSTSASSAPVPQNEPAVLNVAPKPLSGRERFKLQQESLSHKRQALKLRREGRVEEAEAEFELAKALEAQLEESSSQDSTKSLNGPESADDVAVEDLLDPHLLSALKAIGIDDDKIESQAPRRQPEKVNPSKSKNISQERVQLEERIKAEKVKAVNLKHSGKQAEALDALRRAKLFEKKLNSLSST